MRAYDPQTRSANFAPFKKVDVNEEKNVFLAVTNNEGEFKPTDLLVTIVIRRVNFILKCNSFFLIDYF